jgi:hypothetical protein
MKRELRRYESQKIKGLIEKSLTKGKESESALIQLSQIEYISGETLAEITETIQKYNSMYKKEKKKSEKYSKIIKDLLKE